MPTITFAQALKQARAKIYRHPDAWRVAVLCGSGPQLKYAFDEARLTLAASSLPLEKVSYAERTIDTERGGYFKFIAALDWGADAVQGRNFTHYMWLFDPSVKPGLEELLRPHLRSPSVPPEDCLEHHCTL